MTQQQSPRNDTNLREKLPLCLKKVLEIAEKVRKEELDKQKNKII